MTNGWIVIDGNYIGVLLIGEKVEALLKRERRII